MWKPLSTDGYRLGKDSPEARLVTEPVLRWLRAVLGGEPEAFIGEPDETVRIGSISQAPLTKAEAEELSAELQELGARWGGTAPQRPRRRSRHPAPALPDGLRPRSDAAHLAPRGRPRGFAGKALIG